MVSIRSSLNPQNAYLVSSNLVLVVIRMALPPMSVKKVSFFKTTHAWFLRIALSANVSLCVCVCVCMCPPLRLLITSGVIQTPYDSALNKFYGFYMATGVGIVSGRDVSIHTRRGN